MLCGLGTGGLFVEDVADLAPVDGALPVGGRHARPGPAGGPGRAGRPPGLVDRAVRECYPLAEIDASAESSSSAHASVDLGASAS